MKKLNTIQINSIITMCSLINSMKCNISDSSRVATTKKSLVIYGSNLGSTIGMGRLSVKIRNFIFITPEIHYIIIGKLLSDGWLEKSTLNSNARFRFKQSINRADYVISSFIKLSHYCSSLPILVNSQRKGITHFGVVVTTRQLPCLNELYSLFYKNKVKVIPKNIYSLLTPLQICHWIMADGAVLNKGLVLCTDSFTLKEVCLLQDVLKNKI